MRWNEWGQSRQSLAVAWLIPFLFTLLRFCIPLYKVMSMDTVKLVDEMMERLNLEQTSTLFVSFMDYLVTSFYSYDPERTKWIISLADLLHEATIGLLDFTEIATSQMLKVRYRGLLAS